jgi:hypothetical protein
MSKLRTAIRNRKNPGASDIEQMKKELDRVSKNSNISYYDVVLKDVFKAEFEKFKGEVLPVFEQWMTATFDDIIQSQVKGETGIQGIKGEKGDKGDKGDTGKVGATGDVGRQGIQGEKGIQGKQGERGRDGDMGDKGDSVTLEEILEKVGPEIAQFKTEVKRSLSSAKKGGGGGGGGMGNMETFTFTGDESTTAFTLTNKPAANGLAIWAYSEGQWIQPGVHYNVSGKTLTTTFTPEAGTTLEGFYIRS